MGEGAAEGGASVHSNLGLPCAACVECGMGGGGGHRVGQKSQSGAAAEQERGPDIQPIMPRTCPEDAHYTAPSAAAVRRPGLMDRRSPFHARVCSRMKALFILSSSGSHYSKHLVSARIGSSSASTSKGQSNSLAWLLSHVGRTLTGLALRLHVAETTDPRCVVV